MHHFRPARLDPLHVSTVSNSTFVRYQSAVEKFETFLLLFDAAPSSAAELDEWLVPVSPRGGADAIQARDLSGRNPIFRSLP